MKHCVDVIHKGHRVQVFCFLCSLTSNLGQFPQNLLYSSLPLSTSVDSVSLFELAGAPYGSWEHKERGFLLLGFIPASDGSLLFFSLSCHLSFWWLCPHSFALFRLLLLPVLVVSFYIISFLHLPSISISVQVRWSLTFASRLQRLRLCRPAVSCWNLPACCLLHCWISS